MGKHRHPTPSLLAQFIVAREGILRSPISPGQTSEFYQKGTLLGKGTCVETGSGTTRLTGYVPNTDGRRVWEVKAPYNSITHADRGFSIAENLEVKYHDRGTAEHSTLSRHCK